MVQFGKQLKQQRASEWDDYYIDYASLKWLIKKAKRRQKQSLMETTSSGSAMVETTDAKEKADKAKDKADKAKDKPEGEELPLLSSSSKKISPPVTS